MFRKIWDIVDGHKTTLIAGAVFVFGILVLRGVDIPSWLIIIAGAAGLAALRDAVRKIEAKK